MESMRGGEVRRGACRILVRKSWGTRPVRRSRSRWQDNIKMDIQETGWEGWTGFIWKRAGTVAGCCEHGNEPPGSIKCPEIFDELRNY
jgi:hypothetical protein